MPARPRDWSTSSPPRSSASPTATGSAGPGERPSASGCRSSARPGWDGPRATGASSSPTPTSPPHWPSPARPGPSLPDSAILTISFEKGGSSVLADLYLVCGRASPQQERFAFGYGVFLQLLDDLQDVDADGAAGHQTLFTRAAERGPLDAEAARLARFIDGVLGGRELRPGAAFSDREDLICRNCRSLLVAAVADHPRRFTRGFRRRLERQWPLSLRSLRRLRRRAERRCGEAARALERRTGAASLVDWVLAQPG
jgi:hypothetical protein